MLTQHLLSTKRRSLVGLLLVWTSVAIGADSLPEAPAPLAPATAAPAAADGAATDAVANSVVKIFATMRYPDTSRPWTKQAPSEVTASGVIIDGKRILTNAHVVLYATQIQIQANRAGDKIAAKVSAVAPGIDLALLTVDDDSFFESHPPLPRADTLPDNREPVLAYGYPVGGTSLSITKGIVSRIEFTAYTTSVSGLRIQIDAAINPGNSGGPAIAGDKMVGLVFSHLGGAENIGYIIPNEEIDLFLKNIATGHYSGKPAIYEETQTLENPALRAYLKLDKSVEGVVVHRPYRTDPAYPLKEWDVITRIGDTPIDDQGMVRVGANLRVRFQYLVQQVAKNGFVPLTVVRAGKSIPIQLGVLTVRPLLIPDLNGEYPSYFIYGPLVFSKATTTLLSQFMNNSQWINYLSFVRSPLLTERFEAPDAERDELVVVASPLFPDSLSKGYGNPNYSVLHSVNGTPVRSLRQLVSLLRDLKDNFVSFEFDQPRSGEAIVLPRADALAATQTILDDNDVRAQGSADMMAVWDAKTGH